MIRHKLVLQNCLPSNVLSYYTYLYFTRSSSPSTIYSRSLFLFNCLYLSKTARKILCELRRPSKCVKAHHTFLGKLSDRMYDLKSYSRSIYAMRKNSSAIRYFVHNLFKKRSFPRKGNRKCSSRSSRQVFNSRLLLLLRKYLKFSTSKSEIRSASKYLRIRILFFQHLFYLYNTCLTINRSIKRICRYSKLSAISKLYRPKLYKRPLRNMSHYLICSSFVQNILVNSRIGKLGRPDQTRNIWSKIVHPITRLAAGPAYSGGREPISKIIGYIKISGRFKRYRKYLLMYLTALHLFLERMVRPIARMDHLSVAATNYGVYKSSFNKFYSKITLFLPTLFRSCDYICQYLTKRFRQFRFKKNKYRTRCSKLLPSNRYAKILLNIIDVLQHFRNIKVPWLMHSNRMHNAHYALKRTTLNHRDFLFKCVKLAKFCLTYRMYKFFSSLFLFTCAHHSSADSYYLNSSIDVFRYNYLLSCMLPGNSGGIQLVRDYCSRFLRNSDLDYNLVIRTSRSNCTAALLVNGKVIYSSSCGKIGFFKTNRSTYFASSQLGFFLCLFLSSVYGLYLRSGQLRFRPVQLKYLRKYLFSTGYRKFIRKYRMFTRKQRILTIARTRKRKYSKRLSKYVDRTRDFRFFYNYPLRYRTKYLRLAKRFAQLHTSGMEFKSKFSTRPSVISGKLLRYHSRWSNRYRNQFMFAWSNYCTNLLLRRRATCRYNFNTSVASIRLNIHMAGTGISRLAIRKPIRRFVNMIRRATSGSQFFDHSIDASDVRYMAINQLDDSNYLNAENDYNDAVTSDSDGCQDTSYNHGSKVHSFNTDELDGIVASSEYSPKFRGILNEGSIVGSGFTKYKTPADSHCDFTNNMAGILKSKLYGVQRGGNNIFDIKRLLKLRVTLYSYFYLTCKRYLVLYRSLQSGCNSALLSVFKRYLLKGRLFSYSRIFILLVLQSCPSVPHVPSVICRVISVTRPIFDYVIVFLYTEKYLFSLLALRLFLSTLVSNQYHFVTTIVYIYMHLVYHFVSIIVGLLNTQRCESVVSHALFIFLNNNTAIEFFLYDIFVALFSVFFKQVRGLLIAIAHCRYRVHKKYFELVQNVLTTLNSSSCYAQSEPRECHKNGMIVLYNHKTVSVPHNGCRARKMRRK